MLDPTKPFYVASYLGKTQNFGNFFETYAQALSIAHMQEKDAEVSLVSIYKREFERDVEWVGDTLICMKALWNSPSAKELDNKREIIAVEATGFDDVVARENIEVVYTPEGFKAASRKCSTSQLDGVVTLKSALDDYENVLASETAELWEHYRATTLTHVHPSPDDMPTRFEAQMPRKLKSITRAKDKVYVTFTFT